MGQINPTALANLIEGSDLKYRKGSQSYILTCPRCNKKDKLYIRQRDGRFVCFYCATIDNYQGKPEFVLKDLLGYSISHLRELLYGFRALSADDLYLSIKLKDFYDEEDGENPEVITQLPTVSFPLDFYPINHKFSIPGAKYLESRGVPIEIAMEYNIHYHPIKRRVIFPVMDGNRVLGWQARTIDQGVEPKILSSPGLARDRMVMFADRLSGCSHAIITEGPIDAIKCHLCRGNVATMGKVISDTQIQLIKNSGISKVYLALDPDANREISILAKKMKELELYWLTPSLGYKDLGDMSLYQVFEQFHKAPKVHGEYLFSYLKPFWA